MIVEYTRYKIEEGMRKAFEEDYRKAGEALEASVHCLAYELSHCLDDANYYTLRIEWDSEEGHMKGFRTSAEFKAFLPLVMPYTKHLEEMRHYEVLQGDRKG